MTGRNSIIASLAAAMLMAGFGCAQRGNVTPFTLPTGQPPPPLVAPAQPESVPVTIYLVAYEGTPAWEAAKSDPGRIAIGCDDYLIPHTTAVDGDPSTPIRDTMNALVTLPQDDPAYGGAVNRLGPSDSSQLHVGDIAKRPDGTYVVDLQGKLSSGGVCDDPRITEQAERTAGQFGKVLMRLNGSSCAWRAISDQSGRPCTDE